MSIDTLPGDGGDARIAAAPRTIGASGSVDPMSRVGTEVVRDLPDGDDSAGSEVVAPVDHGRASTFPLAGLAALVLAVVVIAPIVSAGIDGLGRTWYPAGDWAMIELRTLDVGTVHTPLVGPYSRYQWNHPGPLLFWVLAVPYRIFGGNPSALLLGAALINATAVAGMLWLAWRRARLALVAPLAFALALLVHNLGPLLLRNPWNAWIVVLPFGLLMMATWSALEGDRLGWPLVAACGAFLAQTHIGMAPFVAAATIAAVVAVLRRRRSWRALVPGLVVLVVCWSPVLVDLVVGSHNLVAIADHFRSSTDAAGWSRGLGVSAREITAPAPWLGGIEEANAAGGGLKGADLGLLVVPLVLFGATLAGAALVRAWRAVRLQIVVAATGLIGVFAVSRITDDVFDYLVRFWWTIAAVGAASMLFSTIVIVRALLARVPRLAAPRVRFAGVALGAVVALVLVARVSLPTVQAASTDELPVDDWFPAMEAITAPTLAAVTHDRPVVVRSTGPISGWVADALTPRLAADGADVRADDVGINQYKVGAFRVVPTDLDDMQTLWVATGSRIQDFRTTGTGHEVASYDPLTPAERAEYDALEQELRATYLAAGRDDLAAQLDEGVSLFSDEPVPDLDPDHQARYEEMRSRGVSVAVFLTDGDTAAPAAHQP